MPSRRRGDSQSCVRSDRIGKYGREFITTKMQTRLGFPPLLAPGSMPLSTRLPSASVMSRRNACKIAHMARIWAAPRWRESGPSHIGVNLGIRSPLGRGTPRLRMPRAALTPIGFSKPTQIFPNLAKSSQARPKKIKGINFVFLVRNRAFSMGCADPQGLFFLPPFPPRRRPRGRVGAARSSG